MKNLLILLVGAGIGAAAVSFVPLHRHPVEEHLSSPSVSAEDASKEPVYSYTSEELHEILDHGFSPKPGSPDIRNIGGDAFELTARFYQHDVLLRKTTYIARCKEKGEHLCCQTDSSKPVRIVDYTRNPIVSKTVDNDHQSDGLWYSYGKWKDQLLMEKSSGPCVDK